MTARRSTGAEKTNILIRSVFDAPAIARTIGATESSGRTISERDMRFRSSNGQVRARWRRAGRRELDAIQAGVDPARRHQLVVRALLGDHTLVEHDDQAGVAYYSAGARSR